MKNLIPQSIKNIYHLGMAVLANIVHGFPTRKLTVIGVTGTDGKTTTASLIYEILKKTGKNVGLVTSISAKLGEREYDTGFHVTSPEPLKLQKFLKEMVVAGCEYAVLEVTSHGLDQHRFWGVDFYVGVLTNITREHLDYHKTYKQYTEAKANLFKTVKYSILNADDTSFETIIKNATGKVIRYAIKSEADIKPKNISTSFSSQVICLDDIEIKTKLLGDYNVYNILAAVAVTTTLGISEEQIKAAIEKLEPLHGRFKVIDAGQDFTIVVDFAHTPNAMEKVLTLSRKIVDMMPRTTLDVDMADKKGFYGAGKPRIIVVFGCAGLRDYKKRPVMGEIACRLADFVVLTAEDPRTEDVTDIIKQIVKGCHKSGGVADKTVFKVQDRTAAIRFAINKLAKKGDLVIITGKGHEKSMCFGMKEYPWSDQKVIREVLNAT